MVRFLIDAGVLGGLILALLLVIIVDRLLPTPTTSSTNSRITPAKIETIATNVPVESKQLRLAVTQSHRDNKGVIWDDMPKLLGALGEGYKFTLVTDDSQLLDAKRLAGFDVLFLT